MYYRERLERRTFLLLLLIVSFSFMWLLKPFFGAIFWAVAIALIFSPVQRRLNQRWPSRNSGNAMLTLLLCVVVLVLPMLFVVGSLVSEGAGLYQRINAGQFDPAHYLARLREAFPMVEELFRRANIDMQSLQEKLAELGMAGSKLLAGQVVALGQNTFSVVLNAVLALYVGFFFLRDGEQLTVQLIRALPLGDARERLLLDRFAGVMRATIKGTLVVALVQGALGGLAFAALGISGALLWGGVMVIASLIPAVGAALIWAPVAVYSLATGDWVSGVVLIVVGVGVIGMVDNLLRPILVGRDTQMPDYLVLLSTLGGLALFGMNGLIIGPIIAALFIAFWEIFMREFNAPDATAPEATAPEAIAPEAIAPEAIAPEAIAPVLAAKDSVDEQENTVPLDSDQRQGMGVADKPSRAD
ncbi:Predicted permease PerM family [gamma proteobacterium HdN1]|nr:Predicted permease PerM family [gamma proteobacterium HdN1]